MYAVTLIAPPSSGFLKPNLVKDLCNAWGALNYVFLANEEAAEFLIPVMPEDRWSMWTKFQNLKIDLVIQEDNARKKSILLADMDSTMIEQECIDELAVEAGVGDEVSQITARAMNGELDFEQALQERTRLLKGLAVEIIDEVYQSRITYMPGGAQLLATMKASGAYADLVSGGFTDFTAKVASTLGFDSHRANRLLQAEQSLTGEVGLPILGHEAKVTALNELTAARGLTPQDVLAVGDGANDLGMLQLAGTGVALHAKPIVQEQVSVRINHGDLTALLYLQGYPSSQFVKT